MDTGELLFAFARLVLGGAAAFFAIMLWSKTRDIAWMLMVGGAIAAYGERVYAVLNTLGFFISPSTVGPSPLAAMVLPNIPVLFFIAAFLVMVIRSYGNR
jgi:hypothetical protein